MTTHDELARRLHDTYSSGAVPPLRDGFAPVGGLHSPSATRI